MGISWWKLQSRLMVTLQAAYRAITKGIPFLYYSDLIAIDEKQINGNHTRKYIQRRPYVSMETLITPEWHRFGKTQTHTQKHALSDTKDTEQAVVKKGRYEGGYGNEAVAGPSHTQSEKYNRALLPVSEELPQDIFDT